MFYQTQTACMPSKGQKMLFFTLVTLTFDLDIQTRSSMGPNTLLCEFGTNPFSGYQDISYTNKKVTDSAKNRTLCSSLCVVKIGQKFRDKLGHHISGLNSPQKTFKFRHKPVQPGHLASKICVTCMERVAVLWHTTLRSKTRHPIFLNNSVKNEPILARKGADGHRRQHARLR